MADSWPPRWRTKPPGRLSDGDDVSWFIETFCRVTKDSIAANAGTLLHLAPWQRNLLADLFSVDAKTKRLRYRTALIGMARKNGKSALSSGIALYGLTNGGDGAEVYSCAGDKEQARIVFGGAKRMVELEPELASRLTIYKDAIEDPITGSVYRCLSAEAYTKEGLNPTLVLFDEVHVQPSRELWDVMSLAAGARPEPLLVGITTAGSRTDRLGQDTLCYGLYQHGRQVCSGEIDDPTFYMAWWEPKAGVDADHTDPKVWAEANPGLGTLVAESDFASVLPRTPESEFRTKRTNVWVSSSETALPHGKWDERSGVVDLSAELVLVVDGSWSGDSTGMVAATVSEAPQVGCIDVWERPDDAIEWRVPINDVKQAVIEFCRTHSVREVLFDPFRWQATMQDLLDEGLPVIEFPNSTARMVPAWQTFYDLVLDGLIVHDGHPTLARHVENMRLKIDAHGARPVKEHKSSKRHIDLGICAVIATARAKTLGAAEPEEFPMAVWLD